MKKVIVLGLVMALATFASADVITDYNVKVTDGSPSNPANATGWRSDFAATGLSGFGPSGGSFQLWGYTSVVTTLDELTEVNSYDDANFTVSWGSWVNTYGPAGELFAVYGSAPFSLWPLLEVSDDYDSGDDTLKMWASEGFGTGAFWDQMRMAVDTTGAGITFTTPVFVTIVNSIEWHKSRSDGTRAPGHGIMAGFMKITGSGRGETRDDMGGGTATVTSLTAVPDDKWDNIDASGDGGNTNYNSGAWGNPPASGLWRAIKDAGMVRLCDGNIAGIGESHWNGRGCGLWINTLGDTVPGNVAIEGTMTGVTGWRNDYDNAAPTDVTILGPIIGQQAQGGLQVPAGTMSYFRMAQAIALKTRESDTATQWLMPYGGSWNAGANVGWGYAKLMITGQKGDLNYDGTTDFNDLSPLSNTWNASLGEANYNPDGDLTGDNVVDFNDLSPLSNYWNQSCQ
jgi:hypothetical protein